MSRGGVAGYLFDHPASRAGTEHTPDASLIGAPAKAQQVVAQYSRGLDAPPFVVVRDTTLHRPYGLYRVYTKDRLLGQQLSFPDVGDCGRMLHAADRTAALYGPAPIQVDHFTQGFRDGRLAKARAFAKSARRPKI